MKKTVFVALITVIVIAVCITSFVSCNGFFGVQNGTYDDADIKYPSVDFDFSSSENALNKAEYYNYNNLTDTQKSMYDAMYEAVSVMQVGNIELCEGTRRDVSLALYALKYDNPHLFWFVYRYAVGETEEGNLFIQFDDGKGESYYIFTHDERVKMMNELQDAVESIINECISYGMTDYEKELALHDWLCENVEYDSSAGDEVVNEGKLSENKAAWTSYGAIVEKKAVCEGYSKGFQLLLYYAGVNSNLVCGMTNERAAHMWNSVLIDGEWYQVDVLWNDVENPEYGITHSFFNVTTDFIQKSRTVFKNSDKIIDDNSIFSAEYNLKLPACNSVKSNYYSVNQTLIASDEEYKSVVENALKTAAEKNINTVAFFYTYKDINENVVSYDIKNNGVFSLAKKYYNDLKGVRYEANSHGSFKINISR